MKKPLIQYHGHRKEWACMTMTVTGFGVTPLDAYQSWVFEYTQKSMDDIMKEPRRVSFVSH